MTQSVSLVSRTQVSAQTESGLVAAKGGRAGRLEDDRQDTVFLSE